MNTTQDYNAIFYDTQFCEHCKKLTGGMVKINDAISSRNGRFACNTCLKLTTLKEVVSIYEHIK